MNPAGSRRELLAQRDNILQQAIGRGLDHTEQQNLARMNQLLSAQQTTRADIHSIMQGETGESLGLIGNRISINSLIEDRDRALQALANVDLPAIQAHMVEMTSYMPKNLPDRTYLFSNPDLSSIQATVRPNIFQSITHDASTQKAVFRLNGLNSIDAIQCNVDFLETEPEEARGVLFHELGHLWTSKIMGLDQQRSEIYIEAFGELFRSAAAFNENAQWAQATGGKGYDVLYGSEVPNLVIPHWQNQQIPKQLFHAGRFLVCNRLIEHLGGLDERTLHGISKACDVGVLPYEGESFEAILRAIEAETGKTGFADDVLHDPVLEFGGMKPGPVAVGMPAIGGNGYRIECFEIKDLGERWGQSIQTYPQAPSGKMDVNNKTFHFEGVQTEIIPFELILHNNQHDLDIRMNVTSGGVVLTPEQILDIGLMWEKGLPAGMYSIAVEVLGQLPKNIETKIEITDAFRQDYQKRKNVKFKR